MTHNDLIGRGDDVVSKLAETGDASSGDEPTAPEPSSAGDEYGDNSSPASDIGLEVLSPTPPATRPAQVRTAELYADVAKLRTGPNLDYLEVETFTGQRGGELTVFGAAVDGWYEIEIEGRRGWMFGSLVVPPEPGLIVAETLDRSAVVLRDADGSPLGRANQSGNVALVTDQSTPLWQVVLPEGGTAWVDGDDLRVVAGAPEPLPPGVTQEQVGRVTRIYERASSGEISTEEAERSLTDIAEDLGFEGAVWIVRRVPVYDPEAGGLRSFDAYARDLASDSGISSESPLGQDPVGEVLDILRDPSGDNISDFLDDYLDD